MPNTHPRVAALQMATGTNVSANATSGGKTGGGGALDEITLALALLAVASRAGRVKRRA